MIGRTISHYKILEKLGEGGMGVVYKAEDTTLKRTVALKFLPIELTRNEKAKKRFVREAQAVSTLDHANICNIHEIGETPEGRVFICMAFYPGGTLRDTIERGRVPVEEALRITMGVARGLAKAHKQGVVHRDVKPGNIILTDEGEIKIVDFGLAKLTGATKVTKTGSTVGTIAYMSPEQTKSEDVDARSDIFSLGVVLYELITGRLPFEGDNEAAVVYGITCRDPDPLSKTRDDVTPELQRVINKTLEKRPGDRYQSACDLADDLQGMLDGMSPVFARRSWSSRVRRHATPLGITAAALLVALLIPPSRNAIIGLFGKSSVVKQIVVLPFENVGDETSNQPFCDGLMETLSSQLTQLERYLGALWVVPASEVRGREVTSPSEARRVFGVNLVVSGGVQRFDGRFRVTLNLIDVSDAERPAQLRSSVIDGFMANVAVLQDKATADIARMLDVELTPASREVLTAGGTAVSGAYELYLEGRGYLQRYERVENIDQAIRSFDRAIGQDSLYALAYAGLGEAYWRKYRASLDTQWVAQAVRNAQKAVELNGDSAPVRVALGMIYRGTGEYEKAVTEFEEALMRDPSNAAAYREMATAYAGGGKLAEAESAYKKAIEMKPDYWGGHYDLGLFYWSHDRPDEAVAKFQRVIELTPDNMWGYNSLGVAYYQLERWDKAREMFERSIQATPNYRAYSNLGNLYYMDGRYADAAATLEKALNLNDTSYKTWANLANAYYWIPEKREEAYKIYRRAAGMAEEQRKINPRDPWLLTSLAGYCAMIGESEKATALAEEALALEPGSSRIAYFAGFTYEQLGEREKAVEWIGKALELGYPLAEVERDPWLVGLRSDQRFGRLLKTMQNGRGTASDSG